MRFFATHISQIQFFILVKKSLNTQATSSHPNPCAISRIGPRQNRRACWLECLDASEDDVHSRKTFDGVQTTYI